MLSRLWRRADEHGDLLKCERADAAPNWLPAPPAGAVALAFLGDGCGVVVMHSLVTFAVGQVTHLVMKNPVALSITVSQLRDVNESWRLIESAIL